MKVRYDFIVTRREIESVLVTVDVPIEEYNKMDEEAKERLQDDLYAQALTEIKEGAVDCEWAGEEWMD